jgi:hypothetical protein
VRLTGTGWRSYRRWPCNGRRALRARTLVRFPGRAPV